MTLPKLLQAGMGTTEELLREGYVILRKVKFLQGDVYHILGQTSADEDVAYVVEWHFLDWRQWFPVVLFCACYMLYILY